MSIPPPTVGSVALVTGASSGIGLALATALAAQGHNLVLVARRRDRLADLAAQVHQRYGVHADVVQCDLADPDDRIRMLTMLTGAGPRVEILVLCAGFGMVGPYLDHEGDRLVSLVRTNVESTMALSHALVPPMVARGRGAVLFVSSIAGNQPIPYFAAYAATKAAVSSLGESLHHELAKTGVTVSVLAPANVSTEFADVADAPSQRDRQPAFLTATAEQCAQAGLDALRRGRRRVTPLPQAAFFAWPSARLPKPIWARVCQMMMQ